jgi:TonB family protein
LELPPPPIRRAIVAIGAFDTPNASRPSPARSETTTGAFGDAIAIAAPGHTRQASTNSSAAEILSKPRPAYTDEARRLRIEGEVLLEVLFGASGDARVLRTIQGLGYGLDDNAIAAARAIRFRPAQRDGIAVDSSAVVRIVFQLAN